VAPGISVRDKYRIGQLTAVDLTTKNQQVVNFVVIFTEEAAPTFVKDEQGQLLQSILYPNWGGAFFWNAKGSKNACSYFAAHLMEILGLRSSQLCATLCPFDQDRLLMNIVQANVHRSSNAHTAFNDLLSKSPFIEINSSLSKLLLKWARAAWLTIQAFDAQSLLEAAKSSSLSAKRAEAAYFHPSLLGRMYFPEEHKYAVYMPLLLPSILPVAFGALKIIVSYLRK